MSIPFYGYGYEVITKSACVDISPGCMTLTVYDSYGDGIVTNNAITAVLDGEEIYNSGPLVSIGQFSTWTAYIGAGNDCEGYTLSPSSLPSTSPKSPECEGQILTVSIPTDTF